MQVIILKNFFTFTYLVIDQVTKQAIIVDPAWDAGAIKKALADFELQGILLTHHHLDHVNAVEPVAKKWDVPVFMSRHEIDAYHFHCRNLREITTETAFSLGSFTVQPWLTPGHTCGSVCYQVDSFLFTGDTVFIEGCGMCNLPGSDPYAMFDSLQKLKKYIPLHVLIYPGHSYGAAPGESFESLLMFNIYLSFEDREHFVAFRMRKNQTGLFNFK